MKQTMRDMLIETSLFFEVPGERTIEYTDKSGIVRLGFDVFGDLIEVVVVAAPKPDGVTAEDLQKIDDLVSDARDAASSAENAAGDARRACDRAEAIRERLLGG